MKRKFLVSYGETNLINVLLVCRTEKIELVNVENLSNGQIAQHILWYLRSRVSGNIVLYNFWEIDE